MSAMDEKRLAEIERRGKATSNWTDGGAIVALVAEVRRQRALLADARAMLDGREWFINSQGDEECATCHPGISPTSGGAGHAPNCTWLAFMRATEPKA